MTQKKVGRPTKYTDAMAEQAYKLALLGLTDVEMADVLGIAEKTIYEWKKEKPEFSQALKNGKDLADSDVSKKLYERATGYEHVETKFFCHDGEVIKEDTIKHYPPDPVSMIYWLKNRQPKQWRDKREIEADVNHKGQTFIGVPGLDEDKL